MVKINIYILVKITGKLVIFTNCVSENLTKILDGLIPLYWLFNQSVLSLSPFLSSFHSICTGSYIYNMCVAKITMVMNVNPLYNQRKLLFIAHIFLLNVGNTFDPTSALLASPLVWEVLYKSGVWGWQVGNGDGN